MVCAEPPRSTLAHESIGRVPPEVAFESFPLWADAHTAGTEAILWAALDERHGHVGELQCLEVLEQPAVLGTRRPAHYPVHSRPWAAVELADGGRPREIGADDQPLDVGCLHERPRCGPSQYFYDRAPFVVRSRPALCTGRV